MSKISFAPSIGYSPPHWSVYEKENRLRRQYISCYSVIEFKEDAPMWPRILVQEVSDFLKSMQTKFGPLPTISSKLRHYRTPQECDASINPRLTNLRRVISQARSDGTLVEYMANRKQRDDLHQQHLLFRKIGVPGLLLWNAVLLWACLKFRVV